MSTTLPTDFLPPESGGVTDARLIETREVTAAVPPGLARRFVLLRVLREAEAASQAVVLRVRDLESETPDVPLVLKWYHRMHAPDREVSRVLREEEGPHLERVLETGKSDGHPYQLCRSHGESHLGDHQRQHPGAAPARRLVRFVRQLHAAVSFLHEHEIVHRDITPDNIMVEARADTAEIVLIDFGAAVHRPDDEVRRFDWRGKPLYLAPEAGSRLQSVSEAMDWWSVGMVTAQLALGRHPMDEREDEAVLNALATRDPDLSGIGDRRVRVLCEGLLTRDPEHRWGAVEVADWLAGGSPATAPRGFGEPSAPRPEPAIRPFAFAGEEFTRGEDLARALDHYHEAARRMLAEPESRAELARWLGQFETTRAHDSGRSTLAALREGLAAGSPAPELVVRLINWLGPRLEATCWGMPMTARGIRELSALAQQGDSGALELVEHLRGHPEILTALAERPFGQGLDAVAERWLAHRRRWPHLVREIRRNQDIARLRGVRHVLTQTAALDARLLELAREPDRTATRLATETLTLRDGLPAAVPWFHWLLTVPDDPLRLLAAGLLAPSAVREANVRHARFLEEEAERLMAQDQDGVIAVMRRLDRLPTLGWALMGATVLTAPWCFLIGLADVLGRAPQEAVVIGWLLALPGTAAVFAAELLTATYIGPPAYHPRRSLAGLLIRTAERPATAALGGWRARLLAALCLVALFLLGFEALTAVPWLWPAATVAALAGWSLYRCHRWRVERRERRSRATPGPRTPGRRGTAGTAHTTRTTGADI
ncbi:serine/threonine protein kinase [Streptomyces mangrovi]|uniref:serine/threonine protein kinase n=1 Tax=Streptomyces mangrovi TaxID=1206892 RepID=UPI00399C96B7